MKKRLRKWLMLLCLGMLLIPSAFAQNEEAVSGGTCGETLTWVLEDGMLTISGTGEMENYKAGTTPWYESRSKITNVEILDGVTSVGQEAFMDTSGLKSVTISGSVKTIGVRAFSSCGRLTEVTLRQGTETLEDGAFEGCSSLKTVTIPASVTQIGSSAFADCDNIANVYYGGSEEDWKEISLGTDNEGLTGARIHYNGENCDHSWNEGTITQTASCTQAGAKTYVCLTCGKKKTEATAMADHEYETTVVAPKCTEQGYTLYACKNCDASYKDNYVNYSGHNYTVSVIEPSCEEQGYTTHVCGNCGDTYEDSYITALGHDWDDGKVTVEPTLESDGELEQTCLRCGKTRNQALPYSTWRLLDGELTILVSGAMENYSVDNKAPWNQQREEITDVVLCDGVTAIGDYWFYGLNRLTRVTIPDSVKSIGRLAFADCSSLACITLPEGLTEIHEEAFVGAGLKCITIPGTVVAVETGAFSGCARLEAATLLQGTQIIGDSVFEGCDKLSVLSIPASVTQIGQAAFGNSGVATIYYGSSEAAWAAIQTKSGNDALDAAQVYYNGANCNHSYDAGTVTTTATCSQNGVKTYICGRCGHEKQELLEKEEHRYTEAVTAPDCTSGGYTTHICKNCGYSYEDEATAPQGHEYEAKVTPPSCTEGGYTTHTCKNCGYSYEDEATAPQGHEYEAKVTAPSCTEGGYTTHICKECGHSYVDDCVAAKGHDWSSGTVTQKATCTESGQKTYICQSCGISREETIEKAAHDYEETRTAPSCTERGYTTYACKSCGTSYVDDYVEAAGHRMEHTTIAPTCTEEGYTIHACQNCDYCYRDSYQSGTGHNWDSGTITRQASCTENGTITFTCRGCGEEKPETIPAAGHSYDQGTVTQEATCTEAGVMTYCCKACNLSYTEVIPQKAHSYCGVVTEPTCTDMGYTTYTCENCQLSYRDDYVSAWEHSYVETQVLPSCTEQGYTLHRCRNCDHSYKDAYEEAVGHSWDSGKVTTKATCTTDGVKTYTCRSCGKTKTETIPATGHNYESKVVKPTCTEKGYTLHTCKNCGNSYKDTETAATGHDWDDGTVTKEPTATEQGVKTYTCQTCGKTKTEKIAKLSNPFTDLVETSSYYNPVLWAVDKGITKGTSDTEFSPKADCTRAQIVTFLWRYAGEPEPTSIEHNFVDLVEDSSYYKAVLWAVEKGITNGIDDTHFGPKEPCTRAQIVTFLWRAAGKPEPSSKKHSFKDIVKGSSYYDAVLWAVEKGITTGADTTHFAPKDTCTRAQGMTFLYRYNNNK